MVLHIGETRPETNYLMVNLVLKYLLLHGTRVSKNVFSFSPFELVLVANSVKQSGRGISQKFEVCLSNLNA